MDIDDYSLTWEELPTEGCSESIAIAFSEFKKELFGGTFKSSFSILSKRYSVFSLLEKHLDKPIEEQFKEYFGDQDREELNEFQASKLHEENIHNSSSFSQYKLVTASLEKWLNILMDYSKKIDQQLYSETFAVENVFSSNNEIELSKTQIQFFALLDSLIYLIEGLLTLKPLKAQIKFSLEDDFEKISTVLFEDKPDNYCKLCWRRTMRSEIEHKNIYWEKKKHSAKYCKYHSPSVSKESWKNYIRDRRYEKKFNHELTTLHTKNESHFLPTLRQIIIAFGIVDPQEKRKLAYNLVHSGLDTTVRKKIIRFKQNGVKNSDIARELGISIQAVSKYTRIINNKLQELFDDVDTSLTR